MPWNPSEFRRKHNKGLSPSEAKKASSQANAILEKTGDEGMAIAVANKNAKRNSVKSARDKRYGKPETK